MLTGNAIIDNEHIKRVPADIYRTSHSSPVWPRHSGDIQSCLQYYGGPTGDFPAGGVYIGRLRCHHCGDVPALLQVSNTKGQF